MLKFNPRSKKLRRFSHPLIRNADQFVPIRKILVDSKARVWLGSDGNGLVIFEPSAGRWEAIPYQAAMNDAKRGKLVIQSLFKDASDRIWIGCDVGLGFVKEDGNMRIQSPHFAGIDFGRAGSETAILSILEQNGNLWFGTRNGLFRYQKSSRTMTLFQSDSQDPYSLPDNTIHCLLHDKSGNIWAGTDFGGISKLDLENLKFKIYRHPGTGSSHHSSAVNVVRSILKSDRHGIYAGTLGEGLLQYDLNGNVQQHYRFQEGSDNCIVGNIVASIAEDRRQQIWIGTRSGLSRLDPSTGQFTQYRHDPENRYSLSDNNIRSICIDDNGLIWLGTASQGICQYIPENERFKRYQHDPKRSDSLSDDRIWCIMAPSDRSNGLWIATDGGGVNFFDPVQESFIRYTKKKNGLSHDNIMTVYPQSKNRVWLGTFGGGLNRLDPTNGQVKVYLEKDGLANNVIYGILEDNTGRLWMSTNHGISMLDPETDSFRNFDTLNGLQSDEFNQGAYCKNGDGALYFGGINGFNRFYPEQLAEDRIRVKPVVTEFKLFNERIPVAPGKRDSLLKQSLVDGGRIRLKSGNHLISFEFSALHYHNSDRIRYVYMLENWDDNWIETETDRRLATYSKLSPGRYHFKVKACNADGVWGETSEAIEIIVEPPLWGTWWAYLIYLASFLGVLYSWKQRQQRRARQLEKIVAERTAELRISNEKLEKLSVTDGLTGLGNRRYLIKFIENEVKLVNRAYNGWVSRPGQPFPPKVNLLFLLMDLDHFKKINDFYGHQCGDMVLVQVADIMRKSLRESDILIRWGGEEFLMICRNIKPLSGTKIAESLRQVVENHSFDIGKINPVKMTISIGFAEYPFFSGNPTLFSWEETLNLADSALYLTKMNGRNGWTGFAEPADATMTSVPLDYFTDIMHDPEKLEADQKLRIFSSKNMLKA